MMPADEELREIADRLERLEKTKADAQDLKNVETSLSEAINKMSDRLNSFSKDLSKTVTEQIDREFRRMDAQQQRDDEQYKKDHDTLIIHGSALARNTEHIEKLNKLLIGNGEPSLHEMIRQLNTNFKTLDGEFKEHMERRKKSSEAQTKLLEYLLEGGSNLAKALPEFIPVLMAGLGLLIAGFRSGLQSINAIPWDIIALQAGSIIAPTAFTALILARYARKRTESNGTS